MAFDNRIKAQRVVARRQHVGRAHKHVQIPAVLQQQLPPHLSFGELCVHVDKHHVRK
jgi:hypothetical protein